MMKDNQLVAFFFGGFYLPIEIDEFVNNSKGALSWANNSLQWGFIKGLSEYHPQIECISFPQIGAYPLRYKKAIYKGKKFTVKGISVETQSYCNVLLVKHFSQNVQLKRIMFQRLKSVPPLANVLIYIYDLNLPMLKAVLQLKKTYKNLRLCLIVPDLPSYTGEESFFYRKFIQLQEKILNGIYLHVDYFVLISEHMREKISNADGKYIRIEGMYNPTISEPLIESKKQKEIKTIFYSGAVSYRNGIVNLLNAFASIPNECYRLCICGVGDATDYVLACTQKDDRIIYKGQLRQEEVLKLQKESTLLVNPRTSELAFSRYSFPSKIMEYFSSGVPTLMYKIDGIPSEYYQYCYSLGVFSTEALCQSIIEICEKNECELRHKGLSAKEFIEKEKNVTVQCGKIYEFIQKEISVYSSK